MRILGGHSPAARPREESPDTTERDSVRKGGARAARRAYGQCSRKQTAARAARVKRRGKSPPPREQSSRALKTQSGARQHRMRNCSFKRIGYVAPLAGPLSKGQINECRFLRGLQNPAYSPTFSLPLPSYIFVFFGSLLRGAKMSPLLPAFIPAQARFAANFRSRKVLPLAGGRAESAFARWRVPANFKFAARLAFWRRRGLLRNGFLRRRGLFAEFAKKNGAARRGQEVSQP